MFFYNLLYIVIAIIRVLEKKAYFILHIIVIPTKKLVRLICVVTFTIYKLNVIVLMI